MESPIHLIGLCGGKVLYMSPYTYFEVTYRFKRSILGACFFWKFASPSKSRSVSEVVNAAIRS